MYFTHIYESMLLYSMSKVKALQKGLFTRGVVRILKHQGLSLSNHRDQNCIYSFSLPVVESWELGYAEVPNY